MIEAVARALHERKVAQAQAMQGMAYRPSSPDAPLCRNCLDEARAALLALREPSPEMVEAMASAMNSDWHKNGPTIRTSFLANIRDGWQAAIDAALSEAGK